MSDMPFYELYCEAVEENEKLQARYDRVRKRLSAAESRADRSERKYDELERTFDQRVEDAVEKRLQKRLQAYEEKISSLEAENGRLRSMLNNDSTNSGVPTSKTPIDRKKRVPNSRTKSGRKKGGQKGHRKSGLRRFSDDEVTETVEHGTEICPECHHRMVPTGKVVEKDELEIQIRVVRRRHRFMETVCPECGHRSMAKIPANLKEENQYGQNVQALALELMNEGFVSMGRTKQIISGLTGGEVSPSEGYISKLQKRLADSLEGFERELKREIIRQDVLHWDDTVIMVSTNRACLRFYGNGSLALYRAHMHKDRESLDDDGILSSLDSGTTVVHDHNRINYSSDYEFRDAECCAHLLRDLRKVDDNLGRKWAKELIDLLVEANVTRNEEGSVDAGTVSDEYDRIIAEGERENADDSAPYYADRERTLLKRLREYKQNYLMWTMNSEIPFTNNEAERSLRGSKTKMKVSGQFSNLAGAERFALIRSYLETGKRHGYNSTELITRALGGEYVTMEEMKKRND